MSVGVVSAKVYVNFVSSHESIIRNREIYIWVCKLSTFSLMGYRMWFAFNVLCYKTYRPVFYRCFRFDVLTSTEDNYLHLLRQVNIWCLTNFFLAVIPDIEFLFFLISLTCAVLRAMRPPVIYRFIPPAYPAVYISSSFW